ncbi:hypothetical protein GMOD_00005348 [Pyrenophora seminiperda CCB06]|uniref:2EXR domain-containing protein n=1 Tax=Pyrenophora seminiperda CCB06 TaxID=1302712 RepID=A0A3M7LVK8_9PLEO|nr:hypothetical protein GMOD_00005348 [Pyrenophora seminiperda CCB06]
MSRAVTPLNLPALFCFFFPCPLTPPASMAGYEVSLEKIMTNNKTVDITAANQRNSPFLRLPAEIRNMIFTYVSKDTTIISVSSKGYRASCEAYWGRTIGPDQTELRFFELPVPLLFTCKQIRLEATSLVYSLALYDVTDHRLMGTHAFNPRSCGTITSLVVNVSWILDLHYLYPGTGDLEPPPDRAILPSLNRLCMDEGITWSAREREKAVRVWFRKPELEVDIRDYQDWWSKWHDSPMLVWQEKLLDDWRASTPPGAASRSK